MAIALIIIFGTKSNELPYVINDKKYIQYFSFISQNICLIGVAHKNNDKIIRHNVEVKKK